MHRFLQFAEIENARVALRSDASIWLMAHDCATLVVDRGGGWQRARRIRLCEGDRVRIGKSEVTVADLCLSLGIDVDQARGGVSTVKGLTEPAAPVPLSAPASVIDDARRNPGTGQIESSPKK